VMRSGVGWLPRDGRRLPSCAAAGSLLPRAIRLAHRARTRGGVAKSGGNSAAHFHRLAFASAAPKLGERTPFAGMREVASLLTCGFHSSCRLLSTETQKITASCRRPTLPACPFWVTFRPSQS
jgi:hypothetical protein